jgi:heme exporter protein A
VTALLTATGIGKSFNLRPVLREVSFSLTPGETVLLFGRNGCGKTTLLKIMAGIMRPERGRASLDSRALFTSDSHWRADMVYLGHRPSLYPAFSARENLRLSLRLRSVAWDENAFQTLLKRYGLAGREDEPVDVYSEGMLQRLGLIRLELSNWKLGLLDEPTSALDADGASLLGETLARWRAAGRTVLFTSHDMLWGAEHADRALHLQRGRITSELAEPTAPDLIAKITGET